MELDVRGEICPYPMMKSVEAMRALPEGEVIQVYTDHSPCLETIPTQAVRYGFNVVIEEIGSPEWRITLTRKT
jgi:tRNA 2-thiouridine synthesizing protein A